MIMNRAIFSVPIMAVGVLLLTSCSGQSISGVKSVDVCNETVKIMGEFSDAGAQSGFQYDQMDKNKLKSIAAEISILATTATGDKEKAYLQKIASDFTTFLTPSTSLEGSTLLAADFSAVNLKAVCPK